MASLVDHLIFFVDVFYFYHVKSKSFHFYSFIMNLLHFIVSESSDLAQVRDSLQIVVNFKTPNLKCCIYMRLTLEIKFFIQRINIH